MLCARLHANNNFAKPCVSFKTFKSYGFAVADSHERLGRGDCGWWPTSPRLGHVVCKTIVYPRPYRASCYHLHLCGRSRSRKSTLKCSRSSASPASGSMTLVERFNISKSWGNALALYRDRPANRRRYVVRDAGAFWLRQPTILRAIVGIGRSSTDQLLINC